MEGEMAATMEARLAALELCAMGLLNALEAGRSERIIAGLAEIYDARFGGLRREPPAARALLALLRDRERVTAPRPPPSSRRRGRPPRRRGSSNEAGTR
jgi:hypothetical protein